SKAASVFDRVLIESRPEFVKEEILRELNKNMNLEVAIGLESASDEVLMHSVNKGFRFADYERAAKVLNSLRIPLRTYLLLKPPFMSEAWAIRDAVASIRAAEKYSETISINPLNIQSFTLVEHLYRKGDYHPPFLWSLLEVLKTESRARLISAPSGGGTRRGVHNCGRCDASILKRVKEFSLTQDKALLEYECDCKEEWKDLLVLEDAVQASLRTD
ncbi:MAG: archaeosine biosynthesis radical SAM protein RaSEA, partial [Thermoplasmata archaeon]|nr:archaeosine biosynthesis radical SAM protein RaSEA [Thermoplasmata archaeon]